MKQLPAARLPAATLAPRRTWLKRLSAVLGGGLLAHAATARPAHVETSDGGDVFLGEIIMVGFNFAPRGYALCQGQLLNISQNPALFAILGTTYGGDGRTTFALPNLQGYTPIGQGQAPGLATYPVGAQSASESLTLTTSQLPAHTHAVPVTASAATSATPAGQVPAVANGLNVNGEAVAVQPYAGTPNVQEAPAAIGAAGNGQAVSLQSPYLVINFCIALQGIFPPRQ